MIKISLSTLFFCTFSHVHQIAQNCQKNKSKPQKQTNKIKTPQLLRLVSTTAQAKFLLRGYRPEKTPPKSLKAVKEDLKQTSPSPSSSSSSEEAIKSSKKSFVSLDPPEKCLPLKKWVVCPQITVLKHKLRVWFVVCPTFLSSLSHQYCASRPIELSLSSSPPNISRNLCAFGSPSLSFACVWNVPGRHLIPLL